jgi:hypothetical protein
MPVAPVVCSIATVDRQLVSAVATTPTTHADSARAALNPTRIAANRAAAALTARSVDLMLMTISRVRADLTASDFGAAVG